MFAQLPAKKLALLIGGVALIFCVVGHFAEAGRTEYDLKNWKITTKGCDGEVCSVSKGVSKVTVQNEHWKDYHGTPPRKTSGHNNGHSSSLRNIIFSDRVIIKKDKCDGTPCSSGSGSDDG